MENLNTIAQLFGTVSLANWEFLNTANMMIHTYVLFVMIFWFGVTLKNGRYNAIIFWGAFITLVGVVECTSVGIIPGIMVMIIGASICSTGKILLLHNDNKTLVGGVVISIFTSALLLYFQPSYTIIVFNLVAALSLSHTVAQIEIPLIKNTREYTNAVNKKLLESALDENIKLDNLLHEH